MLVLISQLLFLANRNAGYSAIILASQLLKIRGHVALLSVSTVNSLCCVQNILCVCVCWQSTHLPIIFPSIDSFVWLLTGNLSDLFMVT